MIRIGKRRRPPLGESRRGKNRLVENFRTQPAVSAAPLTVRRPLCAKLPKFVFSLSANLLLNCYSAHASMFSEQLLLSLCLVSCSVLLCDMLRSTTVEFRR